MHAFVNEHVLAETTELNASYKPQWLSDTLAKYDDNAFVRVLDKLPRLAYKYQRGFESMHAHLLNRVDYTHTKHCSDRNCC